MTKVILTDFNNDGNAPKKRGKFLVFKDLIIIRELTALRVHVAAYSTVRQTFENVAPRVNQNPHMTYTVTCKSVQDFNKHLEEDFDKNYLRNSGLSAVPGCEISDLYQALSPLREDRYSFVDQKSSAKNLNNGKDEKKELLGKKIVMMAFLRKSQRCSKEVGKKDGDGSSEVDKNGSSGRERRKRAKVKRVDLISELALLAEKLNEADIA